MSIKRFAEFLVTATFLLCVLALGALGGCSPQTSEPPAAKVPQVTVMTITPRAQAFETELTGRTQAFMVADIRPQVGGIVQKRLFVEGAQVKAGQALYQLDPSTYQASLAEAQATLAKNQATLKSSQLTAKRNAGLAKIDAISQQDNEDAQANLLTAQADVKVAQAGIETARINLAYTRITAPISGRIETSTVTPGALVTANQDTALTTVQQLDPIYVDVTQSTTDLLRLKRDLASGTLQSNSAGEAQMSLLLEDGSTYDQKGRLKFSGVSVNESTGTVTLRGVVANPDGLLLPGMYVRAVLEQGRDEQAILVPQKSVTRSEGGTASALVLVNGKVEQRALTIGRAIDNQWWITSGLKAGDQVIIEGGQKVHAGDAAQGVEVDTTPKTDTVANSTAVKEG